MNKPFSEACEENKSVILEAISSSLRPGIKVLEIGSGTGQHAVFFAAKHPQVVWQSSDRAENLNGIKAWIRDAGLPNLPPPLNLDVCAIWPELKYDLIFSANSLHIMGESAVALCLSQCAAHLHAGARLIIYGPFNYQGKYTSESNAHFDAWLKSRDIESGIRHFEWVNALALEAGMKLIDDVAMPANNRVLIWQRITDSLE